MDGKVTARRPSGTVIVNGNAIQDTLKCPHCGMPFQITPGSGKKRHFCMNCCAPTCNNPECYDCVPIEKKFEDMESGKKRWII